MATLGGFKSSKAKEWSADLWDRLMDALDARFGPLEEQLDIQRATTDAIVRRGLTVIEELLAPQATNASELLESIEDQKTAAIALVATIQALLDAYNANHLSADLVDETASRLFLTPALKTIYDAKATPADIAAAIDALKGGVSTAYDTLVEIAAKLAADDTSIAGILSALAVRVRFDAAQTLSDGEKSQARDNIGAANKAGDTFTGPVTVNGNVTVTTGDLKAYGLGGNNNQGVVRLNQAGDRYLHYDGTDYNLPGGGLKVGGQWAASQSWVSANYVSDVRTVAASDFDVINGQAWPHQVDGTGFAYAFQSWNGGFHVWCRYVQQLRNGIWYTVG